MRPITYPVREQDPRISGSQRLREVSPSAADAFLALADCARGHATLSDREKELVLLAGLAVARNEMGFRIHCLRAAEHGVTRAELEQLVLLTLGTSVGLTSVIQVLGWVHAEID